MTTRASRRCQRTRCQEHGATVVTYRFRERTVTKRLCKVHMTWLRDDGSRRIVSEAPVR